MAVFSDLSIALASARERCDEEGPAARRGLAGVAYLRARRGAPVLWTGRAAGFAHAPPRAPAGRRLREAA